MGEIHPLDLVVGTILGVALLRGLFLGLIREAFSIAALGGACVTARLFAAPAGDWLVAVSGGFVDPSVAPWVAGAALAVATIAAVASVGRLLQRGARAAGLGWADRAGGAVLGAAEGALVAGIVLLVASAAMGRDHPLLADSRSLSALDELERLAGGDAPRAQGLASPPRSF